ncbi:3-dehydroquinate dehydratase [Gammaproteobacteria bacterium]
MVTTGRGMGERVSSRLTRNPLGNEIDNGVGLGHNPALESYEGESVARLLVLHGPNLNLLGLREPDKYGRTSLADIDARLRQIAEAAGCQLESFQSNAEHTLIDRIHAAFQEGVDFIVINPAAYTHTSVALRDALLAVKIPFIEVHLSNVYAREPFRHRSYFSDVAVGVISGLGAHGYELALTAALKRLADNSN